MKPLHSQKSMLKFPAKVMDLNMDGAALCWCLEPSIECLMDGEGVEVLRGGRISTEEGFPVPPEDEENFPQFVLDEWEAREETPDFFKGRVGGGEFVL